MSESKRQFNIFIEQEYIDILTAYGIYLKANRKIKTASKTEAFREAMKFVRLGFPLDQILKHIEETKQAAREA